MRVVTVESRSAEWDLFVHSSEKAEAYHCLGWRAVFTESFGHRCYYLAAIDENDTWQGILPLVHMRSKLFGNFLVSLPFVNYGGLLCESEAAAKALLDEAERIRCICGAAFVELRHIERRETGHLPTKQHKVTMLLDLASSTESQWQAFDPKLRNQIRKAQKNGLNFRMGRLELLSDFYEVFARNMRDLGTPVYSKRFFCNVMETFGDSTAIGAVYHDGKIVAAGLAVWFAGKIEIPWASSIKDYKSLCPNHMLYWELMQFAIARGFTEFDFGRSTPDEGTYNFKKQWGAKPIQLNWQYLMEAGVDIPELNPRNSKYRMAIRAWQRLPVPITKALGPWIVRSIP